jgi:hypothetical protein
MGFTESDINNVISKKNKKQMKSNTEAYLNEINAEQAKTEKNIVQMTARLR